MDKIALAKWKTEMESELAEVEKQLFDLESKRAVLKVELGAVVTLLSPTEQVQVRNKYEVRDPVGEFIATLKGKGWSVENHGGKIKNYVANRGGHSVDLWIKFSKRSEVSGQYWFGINPDRLENKNGGVILLLGTHQQYICLPFINLLEMLEGSKNTVTGQKFQVRQNNGQVELQPAGIGGKWINVTPYYAEEGLERIGIN
jgi:hypothetical protein